MSAPNSNSPVVKRVTRSGVRHVKYREEGRAGRVQVQRETKRAKVAVGGEEEPKRHTRQSLQELEALKTPSPSTYNIVRTPEEDKKHRTRSQVPRCLDFGPYRHIRFPKEEQFFFCAGCDELEQRLPDDRRPTNAKVFNCTAKHSSFLFPTDRRKPHIYLAQFEKNKNKQNASVKDGVLHEVAQDEETNNDSMDYDEVEDDEESDSKESLNIQETPMDIGIVNNQVTNSTGAATPPSPLQPMVLDASRFNDPIVILPNTNRIASVMEHVSTPENNATQMLTMEIQRLHSHCSSLKCRNKKLHDRNSYLSRKIGLSTNTVQDPAQRSKCRQTYLKRAIEVAVGKCRHGQEKARANLIAHTVWEMYNGAVRDQLIVLCKAHLRQTVFTPFKILKYMDLSGGTLSYTGVETLRQCEKEGRKYVRNTMIPSATELQRAAMKTELYATEIAGDMNHSYDPELNEVLSFEYSKIIPAVYDAFGLYHTAQDRCTSIARSIDGTTFSHNHHALVGGAKIQDPAALCPLTNTLILDEGKDLAAQSRNLVIPLKITKCKESKKSLRAFDDMFSFFDNCESMDPETNPLASHPHNFKPFKVATNVDMAAAQKGLNKGGGMKTCEYGCHCCSVRVDDIATPNHEHCSTFCRQLHSDDPEWKCYHHDIINATKLEEMQSIVHGLTTSLAKDIGFVDTFSKIETQDVFDPGVASQENPYSLHYNYTGPDAETGALSQNDQQYLTTILHELRVRGLSIEGGRLVRLERLRKCVERECRLRDLSQRMKQMTPDANAVFLIMSTVPCILHAENRMGLKLFTMLLMSGLSNAGDGTILLDQERASRKRQYLFISKLEDIINTKILGDERDKAWWRLPFDKGPNGVLSIGTITLDNNKTRGIVNQLELVITLCLQEGEQQRLWLKATTNYRSAMRRMRSKEDFTDIAIADFQRDADTFFSTWISLYGSEGVTNYIHMLGAGHFAEYLYKWKNLYRHSQQGWEAFNALLKTFYYRRTQRGGGRYGKSVLIPIGKWLHRRIVWLNDVQDNVIEEHYKETTREKTVTEEPNLNDTDDSDDDNEIPIGVL